MKDLTSHLKGTHHHVYIDNYFNSIRLLEDLEKDGIYGCGTIQVNRKGYPESQKKLKLSNKSKDT